MAKPSSSSWIAHVESFVDSSRPSRQQVAEIVAIATLVKEDQLTIEALVIGMGQYLTTTDHAVRSRGILLLAEILNHLPAKPLHSQTIKSLAEFFTAKLEDWHSLHGALVGSLAILRRKKNYCVVESSEARAMAQSFLRNVHVQSLAVIDRKLCFEILLLLLNVYPKAVAELDDELVIGICGAIDEEKDPSCLILTFNLVGSVARLFPEPEGPVSSLSQDLFDILSQYFPIYFTHPNNQNLTIKREDLSKALMHAFVSCPFFEPFVVPLLIEKLSSSFPLAKIDSLKYLDYCIRHYGVERMVKHATTIWSSLKEVIFSSAQFPLLSTCSEPASDAQSEENQIAKEALNCLRTAILCLDSCNKDSFLSFILEDDDIKVRFWSIIKERTLPDISENNQHQLNALGSILYTASNTSMDCCNRVLCHFFPHLMNSLGVSSSNSSFSCSADYNTSPPRVAFGALYICIELLTSCRQLCLASKELSPEVFPDRNSWLYLLQDFCRSLCCMLEAVLSDQQHESTNVRYAVRGLEVLATFPGFCSPLSDINYEEVLTILMSIVICKFEDTFLWISCLNALVYIGSCVANDGESFKGICYERVVLERIASFLHDDSIMSLEQKLNIISKISSIGKNAAVVTQKLEEVIISYMSACLRGNLESVQILGSLLDCFTCQVLPWFSSSDFKDIAAPFVMRIWSLVDDMVVLKNDVIMQGLLDKLMVLMKLMVGGLFEESQHMILQKAYRIVSSNILCTMESLNFSLLGLEELNSLQEFIEMSCKNEWIVSLFASMVITLRQQTPIMDAKMLLNFFMIFLLRGCVPAAQALSSILNKLPADIHNVADGPYILDEAIEGILEKASLSLGSLDHVREYASLNKKKSLQVHTIIGLAWVCKGLLMRGHEKVKDIVMLLLKCLISSQNLDEVEMAQQDASKEEDGQDQQSCLEKAAADAFHVILSDSEVCLNKKFHATIRPLYKQRFFSSMLPILLSSIRESSSIYKRRILHRAFGYLITDAPLAAVVADCRKIVPSILVAFATLSLDIENKDLVYSLLLVFSGILMDDDGKEFIMENINHIVGHLIKLISYPYMALVRETAIQCLVAMSGLPHTKIYPIRSQILQAVSVALDDQKRVVRQEAVRCRQAWASSASRNLMF